MQDFLPAGKRTRSRRSAKQADAAAMAFFRNLVARGLAKEVPVEDDK